MKRTCLYALLAALAVFCVLFCFGSQSASDVFLAAAAFPFYPIGAGLRALSLASPLGNGAALAIYVALGLFPAFALLDRIARRVFRLEDCLLGVLSIVLLDVLYLMANPSRLRALFPLIPATQGSEALMQAICGGLVWTILIGYGILRLLRLFSQSTQERLYTCLEWFLSALAALFVLMAAGSCLGGFLHSIRALQEGNSGDPSGIGMSCFFLLLRFVTQALPWVLDIVTVFYLLKLIQVRKSDPYSAQLNQCAGRLSHWCVLSLSLTLCADIAYQLLQFFFLPRLRDVDSTISIPVPSICFVLLILLFTRILEENTSLKNDNDLFI